MTSISPDYLLDAARCPVAIPGAVQFDMTSTINGRTYRIFVVKPASPPPPLGYPVVTVTDANLNFPIAATMNGAMAMQGGRAALIVGVGYPATDMMTPMLMRLRDLTPPTPIETIQTYATLPSKRIEDFGGAEDFQRFLLEELRPAIARAYSVDANDQTLYGHSLGGLFALEVLFSQPGAFRTFVASSPSIWWNNRGLLGGEAAFAEKIAAGEAAPRVLIMIGDKEQTVPDAIPPNMTREAMEVLLFDARMVDNARELAERLARIAGKPGYTVRYTAFDDEDHMSVLPGSISRALVFALRG